MYRDVLLDLSTAKLILKLTAPFTAATKESRNAQIEILSVYAG
jgi:hypothetical protein